MTLMNNNVEFVFSKNHSFDFSDICSLEIFSELSISFLNDLSKELLKFNDIRKFPDVATFGFFCRKANINLFKNKNYKPKENRVGRGIAFHIAPSNVPVNFAYSLVAGILSGNINIVRLPSKSFEEINIICNAIKKICLLDKYEKMAQRICLIKYDKNSNITKFLSENCDVRVIWGGDKTINEVKSFPTSSRTFDVTFPDRYSFCVINADELIKEVNIKKIAERFYNDTFLFDQNACTSPHLLCWTGQNINIQKSKFDFWNQVEQIVEEKYELNPISSIDKLTTFYSHSLSSDLTKEGSISNKLWRIRINNGLNNFETFKSNCGYFLELDLESINETASIVNRKYQTMSYYGYSKDELISFVKNNKLSGIDRIVPIGRTMDFSLTWDGYDLIRTLSRICQIL